MADMEGGHTSESDPLRIDSVAVPNTIAQIGITLCPGKQEPLDRSGAWQRDLDADLQAIQRWGATTLVSLIEAPEFTEVKVDELPNKAKALGLDWRHWPIRDRDIPDARFEYCWARESPIIICRLEAGQRVVVHCMCGLGRSGLVAAKFLCEFGVSPLIAVQRVRTARPGAIETGTQRRYIMGGEQL